MTDTPDFLADRLKTEGEKTLSFFSSLEEEKWAKLPKELQAEVEHRFSGAELQQNYAQDTLTSLYKLWRRPVHIETKLEGASVMWSFDGTSHTSSEDKKKG